MTGARAGDATGEGSDANVVQDDEVFVVTLGRQAVQREGERLSLVRPGTGARANDGSGCDHYGEPVS